MTEIINYSPIFDKFNIHYVSSIHKYIKNIDYNNYEYEDTSGNIKECFIKYIPLIDYVKLLTGKYKKYNIYKLPEKNKKPENLYEEYIHSINNYSYVDSFFYLLSSKLKDYGFIHSLDVYDSVIELKENFEIDIADDYEYICESSYFSACVGNFFNFKNDKIQKLITKTKEPIHITNENIELNYETIDGECETLSNNIDTLVLEDDIKFIDAEIDNIFKEDICNNNIEYIKNCILSECNNVNEEIENKNDELLEIKCEEGDDDSDDDDERDDDSDDDDEDDDSDEGSDDDSDDDEDDDDEESDEYTDEEEDKESLDSGSISLDDEIEELKIVIDKLPCQKIALEKCENTLDSLFEKDIKVEELTSAIFQVIVMLDVYQKMFDLTHNDLHTNNIMFIETKEEYLYYKINQQFFKVPTFGRIYKIIDFGRAIYQYNNERLCSDSFSSNGTAYGQYNCEPFYNQNKHKIEPNPSFDLCRLACSIFDFIVDDYKEVEVYRNIPVYNMIIKWLYDDENKNILYKENGKERYPDFKLYKMIAKKVHHHIPCDQYNNDCFKPYCIETLEKFIDIDELVKKKVRL